MQHMLTLVTHTMSSLGNIIVCDSEHWNIGIPPVMEELPTVYWMPKLRKNLYESRFIAVSNKCTTKLLSCLLTTCLMVLLVHLKNIVKVFVGILELIVFGLSTMHSQSYILYIHSIVLLMAGVLILLLLREYLTNLFVN